jgi:EpsI family protein
MLSIRPAAVAMFVAMSAISFAAETFKPTERVADQRPKIDLDAQVPLAFDGWLLDRSIIPIAPSPDVQASLDALYSATLARTYINSRGQRVMLSIAYGSDQSSEATSVHRPEFCYSAQGFRVKSVGEAKLMLDGYALPVQRLIAQQGQRLEPITYWITIDDEATLPGLGRKLEQLRYGLQGKIPDGMLVRVSTVGLDEVTAFKVQEDFLRSLYSIFDSDFRNRYFGMARNT